LNAARKRRLAGIAQVFFRAPVLGEIGLGVKAADRDAGDRGKAGMAVLIEIRAGGRAYWFFGRLFQRRQQRFLRPFLSP